MIRGQLQKKGSQDKYELSSTGVGGNKVRDLLARFEKDVISQKPFFLMIGINDVVFFTW